MKKDKIKINNSLVLILVLALILSVFILPGQLVQAQTVYVSGPNSATIGTPLTVTIGISPAVQIANGFDVNVNYDAAGLQYNGYTAHISTMSPSVSPGNGLIILGYQGGKATGGNVFSLSFTPTAAGTYRITVGGATYGLGEAAGGASLGIHVAAAPPPATPTPPPLATVGPTPMPSLPAPTPTPRPTLGPTPMPSVTSGSTLPLVTLGEESNDPTEVETDEPALIFYTFDGKALLASDQAIPLDRYTFDYAREDVMVFETTVQVLQADGRLPLFWLETVDGEAGFYLHWQLEDRYVPYRLIAPLGDAFVILPPPSDAALPEGFVETELEIDGIMYPAFKAISAPNRPSTAYGQVEIDSKATSESQVLPEMYVVYARVQRPVLAVEEEQAGQETATDQAEEKSWDQGEYYLYDQEGSTLFPFSLFMLHVTQTMQMLEAAADSTPPATKLPSIETSPVKPALFIKLLAYEYDVRVVK